MFKTTTAEDHVLVSSELEGEREGEREKDVRESLLKYLGLRHPKSELYEIYKKLKSHAIYKITTSCNMK